VKIISGGQTGVDRAALDVAILLGIPHGGWCPKNRLAEDGRIADCYQLVEHASPHYDDRTRENVRDSDATLILCLGPISGGTRLTRDEARRQQKPCLVLKLSDSPDIAEFRGWLEEHKVQVLNIAGPRESQCPGIGAQAAAYLRKLLAAE
jgi:hypothetical protein